MHGIPDSDTGREMADNIMYYMIMMIPWWKQKKLKVLLTSSSSLIEDRAAMAEAIPAFLAWTSDWTTGDKGDLAKLAFIKRKYIPQPSTPQNITETMRVKKVVGWL